ncbi:DegT/DnrJ/EryC1/StrS family aminotransferase [Pseudomonadales bacterium]|nr:DegT/DnrJ/EryC1/StrS family aminotransferase [Pseudomonadales bacterium]
MKVPFIDLKRFEPDFLPRWQEKVGLMSVNASFIGGDEVATLEERLKAYVRVQYAITCANGTDAIQLALRALGVGRDDLVIVPDLTFWATFEAVVNVGAKPVTVDSDAKDGGIDFESFMTAIKEHTPKAAIIAHLYGWASQQLAEIRKYCGDHGVLLIEDGAQSFGVSFQGDSIYKDALISTTSFYPAKVLGAAGDGGAVFTNDAELAAKVRQLSNHGRSTHYGYAVVGWNSRLDSLQAAFLNIALDFLPQRIASRRDAVAYYNSTLPALGVTQISAPADYLENGYCNVCLIEDPGVKLRLESLLKQREIGFGNVYPGSMSSQPGASNYLHAHVGNGSTNRLCASVVNLPIFPYMKQEELSSIIDSLALIFNKR